MSRCAVVVALAALVTVPTAAGAGADGPVLALVSQGPRAELAWLDPASLEPHPGAPTLPLGLQDIPWARSPDGSQLAVGSGRSTSLVFVDLRSMSALGRVGTAFMTAIAWPRPNRLLLLEHTGTRWRFTLVDPTVRTALSRRRLGDGPGDVISAATTRDGLAVLMAPGRRVGAPWLVLLDAEGRARRVALSRIAAGTVKKQLGERYRVWHRHPGLAVDVEGGRAYVVTAGSRVAEVDLASLTVSYRRVRVVRAVRAWAARLRSRPVWGAAATSSRPGPCGRRTRSGTGSSRPRAGTTASCATARGGRRRATSRPVSASSTRVTGRHVGCSTTGAGSTRPQT